MILARYSILSERYRSGAPGIRQRLYFCPLNQGLDSLYVALPSLNLPSDACVSLVLLIPKSQSFIVNSYALLYPGNTKRLAGLISW